VGYIWKKSDKTHSLQNLIDFLKNLIDFLKKLIDFLKKLT